MVIMPFELLYHDEVKTDKAKLDEKMKERVKTALETRLTTAPHQYGEPLRKNLKGYWKLRVGDYRIVFKIEKEEVWIFGIIHRKEVYKEITKRL